MAGKVRHLVNRSGRYHARLVVPLELRGVIGKTELRTPLGGDYKQALRLLPGAVAQLQNQITVAERMSGQVSAALRYAMVSIDDMLVRRLRDAKAGRADDQELEALVGPVLNYFRSAGNLDAAKGSDEWREIARALCIAEYEALERVYERDEGDFAGFPTTPILIDAEAPSEPEKTVSIKRLWSDYVAVRKQAGFMLDGGKRQSVVVDSLRQFLKHDNARRVTKKNVLDWRDDLMKTLAAKTVSDVYLSTIRTLFEWAVDNDQLLENPASSVKQPKPRKVYGRERGYTDAEAVKVLSLSRAYAPQADINGYIRERPELVSAKRWVPIICAFTGARVSELTQLRREDLRQEDGIWIARITPEAGSVKAGGYRDVPLHPQIIEEGFADFLTEAGQGPLFHNGKGPDDYVRKSKQISNQLASWLTASGLLSDGLAPNHAWRHRFKTQCIELGISDRVMDAIQGHAGRTAGDTYGDVTLKAKRDALWKLEFYDLTGEV